MTSLMQITMVILILVMIECMIEVKGTRRLFVYHLFKCNSEGKCML